MGDCGMAESGPLRSAWKDWGPGALRDMPLSISGRIAGLEAGIARPGVLRIGALDDEGLVRARCRCDGGALGRSTAICDCDALRPLLKLDGTFDSGVAVLSSRCSALMRPERSSAMQQGR